MENEPFVWPMPKRCPALLVPQAMAEELSKASAPVQPLDVQVGAPGKYRMLN